MQARVKGAEPLLLSLLRSQNKRMTRYSKLTRGLCELVDDFGLVSFATLNVQVRSGVSVCQSRNCTCILIAARLVVDAPRGSGLSRCLTAAGSLCFPLSQEEESMRRLVGIIDKSNGYVFAGAIKKARSPHYFTPCPRFRPVQTNRDADGPLALMLVVFGAGKGGWAERLAHFVRTTPFLPVSEAQHRSLCTARKHLPHVPDPPCRSRAAVPPFPQSCSGAAGVGRRANRQRPGALRSRKARRRVQGARRLMIACG